VIERRWPLLASVNGAYALWWFVHAGARVPLWYDEMFTVRLSALGGVRELWRALSAGFDFNPPGLYVVTRIARLLPVADPLNARLPALFGFALVMFTMFVFLQRRVGSAVATAALALMPLANFVERYAIEARAYMLLLGVSGCAIVCWQAIGESTGRRRLFAAAGLAIAVAVALTLHVWSIILPAAVIAAEGVILIQTGRVRWIVLTALVAAAPVLTMYPTLLAASRTAAFTNEVYAPSAAKVLSALLTIMPRLRAVALVALTVVVVRLGGRMMARSDAEAAPAPGLLPAERALLIALALSPLIPYGYALVTNGAFMTRYAVYAVIGVAGLLADGLHLFSHRTTTAGAAAAVVASAVLWAYLPARVMVGPGEEVPSLRVLRGLDRTAMEDAPLVLVNPLDVIAIDERSADRDRRDLTFVADAASARRYTGTDLVDLSYLRGEPYLHMRIPRTTYVSLTTGSKRLYLLGEWKSLTWLPQRLSDDGWTLNHIGGTAEAPLFEAMRKTP